MMAEAAFPGRELTEREFTQVVDVLSETPISYFIAVDIFGRVITFPPFHPTEMLPDIPALLRYMADQLEPLKREGNG